MRDYIRKELAEKGISWIRGSLEHLLPELRSQYLLSYEKVLTGEVKARYKSLCAKRVHVTLPLEGVFATPDFYAPDGVIQVIRSTLDACTLSTFATVVSFPGAPQPASSS